MYSFRFPCRLSHILPIFPSSETLRNLQVRWDSCELDHSTELSVVWWPRVGIRDTPKIQVIRIVVTGFRYRRSTPCDALLWLLLRVFPSHDPFDYFGLDLQSELVLPQNLRLCLVFVHQACNTQTLLLVFLDKRVDVLRHLLRRSTALYNVLFVDLDDLPKFLEVFLVSLDFLHKIVHQDP